MKNMAVVGLTMWTIFTLQTIHGALYDLKADWSDTANPNGAWSYWVKGSLAISGTRGSDIFPGGPPPIWTAAGVPDWQGWSKSRGGEGFQTPGELQAGDVYGHTSWPGQQPIEIRWTSPSDGVIDLTGNTWHVRDIERTDGWSISLLFNDRLLAIGTTASSDGHGRANPRTFILSNVRVNAGDVLVFSALGLTYGGYGDYLGVNLSVNLRQDVSGDLTEQLSGDWGWDWREGSGEGTIPVPEPSTCLAGALLILPFGLQTLCRFRAQKQGARA